MQHASSFQLFRGLTLRTPQREIAQGPLADFTDLANPTLQDPERGPVPVHPHSPRQELFGLPDANGQPLFDGDLIAPVGNPHERWRIVYPIGAAAPYLNFITTEGMVGSMRLYPTVEGDFVWNGGAESPAYLFSRTRLLRRGYIPSPPGYLGKLWDY